MSEIDKQQMQNDIEVLRRMSDSRLERIEKKIDQLSDAMVTLARAEEKLIGMEKNNQIIYDRLNRHSEKIDHLEATCDDNANTIAIMTKGMWLLFGTAVMAIVSRVAEVI